MGKAFSDLTGDSSAEVKEQLEILQEMAHTVLEAESKRMSSEAYEDKTLPIVAVVDTQKFTSMDATSGVSEKVDEVVDNLFDGKYMSGFKKGVTALLDTFLGSAEAGKSENTEFHIVYDNNALLRIDLYFYQYHFASEGLKAHGQNMFCYVAQIGVLDAIKVNPQTTLYEVSKSIGSESKKAKELLDEDADFVEAFMKRLDAMTKAQKELGVGQ